MSASTSSSVMAFARPRAVKTLAQARKRILELEAELDASERRTEEARHATIVQSQRADRLDRVMRDLIDGGRR